MLEISQGSAYSGVHESFCIGVFVALLNGIDDSVLTAHSRNLYLTCIHILYVELQARRVGYFKYKRLAHRVVRTRGERMSLRTGVRLENYQSSLHYDISPIWLQSYFTPSSSPVCLFPFSAQAPF